MGCTSVLKSLLPLRTGHGYFGKGISYIGDYFVITTPMLMACRHVLAWLGVWTACTMPTFNGNTNSFGCCDRLLALGPIFFIKNKINRAEQRKTDSSTFTDLTLAAKNVLQIFSRLNMCQEHNCCNII